MRMMTFNVLCIFLFVTAQQVPLTPPKRPPVPMTDKDQARQRHEAQERAKSVQPRLLLEKFPIRIVSFACPSKLKSERTKKVTWIKINNTDSQGRTIIYLEWIVWVYDPEVSKKIPIAHLLASGETNIEAGKEGMVQHLIRNPVDTKHKDVFVCVALIGFSDGTEWAASPDEKERNCW